MFSAQKDKQATKSTPSHESGALAGWGMLGGIIAGVVVGIFIGHYVILAFSAGAVGWVVGALIERARR